MFQVTEFSFPFFSLSFHTYISPPSNLYPLFLSDNLQTCVHLLPPLSSIFTYSTSMTMALSSLNTAVYYIM